MHKKLIICADGTWNWPDQKDPTNVIKTVRALDPVDREGNPQIVFYDQGVGTFGGKLKRLWDGALGSGLSQNIEDTYRFLANNYAPGDKIYFFGFSRGAYTVRSLAGLIGRVGLLHRGDMEHFQAAYKLYRMPRTDDSADEALRARRTEALGAAYERAKEAFLDALLRSKHEPSKLHPDRRAFPLITFIGVWDTVGSLGIPAGDIPLLKRFQPTFHDTELNCFVENAYQALAIDERRRTFQPAVWRKRTDATPPEDGRPWVPPDRQHVEQRWFPGAHSNVGGGYEDSGLSDVAWRWMIDRARRHGLAFDDAYVARSARDDLAYEAVPSEMAFPWRYLGFEERVPLRTETEMLHHTVHERWSAEATGAKPPFKPHPYRPEVLRRLLAGPPVRDWGSIVDMPPKGDDEPR